MNEETEFVFYCNICKRFVNVDILDDSCFRCQLCQCHLVDKVSSDSVIDFDIESNEEDGILIIDIFHGSLVIRKDQDGIMSFSMNVTKGLDRTVISRIMNMIFPRLHIDLDGRRVNQPMYFSNMVCDTFFRLFPSLQHRATVDLLNSLPCRSCSEEDKDQVCPICLQEFNDCQIIDLPCNHSFHKECIFLWMASNVTCPYCRKEINNFPNEEIEEHIELD